MLPAVVPMAYWKLTIGLSLSTAEPFQDASIEVPCEFISTSIGEDWISGGVVSMVMPSVATRGDSRPAPFTA